jgi:hypothetical protein
MYGAARRADKNFSYVSKSRKRSVPTMGRDESLSKYSLRWAPQGEKIESYIIA